MKKRKTLLAMAFTLVTLIITSATAFSASNAELEDRIKALENNPQDYSNQGVLGQISDRITLSGAVELDYSYANDSDLSDKSKNSSNSELEIGTIELGLEARLHEYVTANVVLKGESLDSDDDRIFWDEVSFTFQKEGMPVYFIGGLRGLPFGTFESLFINDSITQDLYEICKSGATIGYADENLLNMDLSFTLYKGESLISRLHEAEYGWERSNSADYEETDTVSSYIVNASFSPAEGLTLAAYFNSEPGESDRNTTLGGSVHWEIADFIVDGEYITALNREKHMTDNKEYNEKAWFVSLGYKIASQLLLAVRYEDFDADRQDDENLDNRYSFGATYTLFESSDFTCNLMGEYRRSEFEASAGSTNNSDLDEVFTRIALEF